MEISSIQTRPAASAVGCGQDTTPARSAVKLTSNARQLPAKDKKRCTHQTEAGPEVIERRLFLQPDPCKRHEYRQLNATSLKPEQSSRLPGAPGPRRCLDLLRHRPKVVIPITASQECLIGDTGFVLRTSNRKAHHAERDGYIGETHAIPRHPACRSGSTAFALLGRGLWRSSAQAAEPPGQAR